MKIHELSAQLDEKLTQVDTQLHSIQTQLAQQPDAPEAQQWAQELVALSAVKRKLQKSQAVAWQAHTLATAGLADERRLRRQQSLGLWLCVLSGIALVAVIAIAVWINT